MRKQKGQTSRNVLERMQHRRVSVLKKRPLHRHIALHPINVLVLVCVGVLLVTFTLNAVADSYRVTAVVPAPPLTDPAVITSPADGAQFTAQALTVSGTCPDDSYVNLLDNGNFVGTDTCSGSLFQISLDLTAGANQLQAQDYNITNAPGPASGAVTVTYTPLVSQSGGSGSPASGIATPLRLIVTQVDTGVPYIADKISAVSLRPTLAGVAPPGSHVTVMVYPTLSTCDASASLQGYWSCRFAADLPLGAHTVHVAAMNPGGDHLAFPSFTFDVTNASPLSPGVLTPLSLTAVYTYGVHNIDQSVPYDLQITGGRVPYAFTVLWGDGQSSAFVRSTPGMFTTSHIYNWINTSIASERIEIQAIDAAGQSATLQLSAVLRNPVYHSAIAGVTRAGGLWGLFGKLRPWLWLLWPGYGVVVLSVFSFWLGEQQELAVLKASELARSAGKRPPRRAAHRL